MEKYSLRVELDPKFAQSLRVESVRRGETLSKIVRAFLVAWLKRDPRAVEIVRESSFPQSGNKSSE